MVAHSDLYYNTLITELLAPAVRTTSANSASVDLQNYDSAVIGFNVGASGDTWSNTTKICLEVQDSPDNSTWTACADAVLTNFTDTQAVNTGTVAVMNSNALGSAAYFTGYIGNQRYVRGVLNYQGTHATGSPVDVFALAGRPRQGKVNP